MTVALVSQILANVAARLSGISGLVFKVGSVELTANDVPPRIVCRILGGPGGPIQACGGNPRPLRSRHAQVEVHCWGADLQSAELLLHAFVAATHLECHGSYDFVSERWPTQDKPAWATYGELAIATVEYQIPITDLTSTLAAITSVGFDTAGASPTDGILQAGEG